MRIVLVLASLLVAGSAVAQEADPATSKADPTLRANPWGADQRCGLQAQHQFNQAYLNCGVVTQPARPYLEPTQGQTLEQQIFQTEPARSRHPR